MTASSNTRLERVVAPNDPSLTALLACLASIRQDQGDLAAARSLFERALAARENSADIERLMLMQLLGRLGSIHKLQGNEEAAQRFFARSIAVSETVAVSEVPRGTAPATRAAG